MKFLVIGGNAAGMSAASRVKRKSPDTEVVVLEQTHEVSYGACGLPYYVAGLNNNLDLMRIRKADQFLANGVDLRLGCDVTGADFTAKTVSYTDENGAEVRRYGFTYGGIVVATPLVRLQYSWYNTLDFVRLVRMSLMMLVSGSAGLDDLSGPVGIVSTIKDVGEEAQEEAEKNNQNGFAAAAESILYFGALIAVNLAVMNLLPLPALDGGKVFFLVINTLALALFKRQIPPKYENYIHMAGFALLMALMLFITFHDVMKLL